MRVYTFMSTLLSISAMVLPFHIEANEIDQISTVKQTVEAFCKAEFEGDEFAQRVKLIKFSQPRLMEEKKRTGPASPWVVFWDWDAFYVVSSYKILNIELKGDRALAAVAYRRIAESKGKGVIVPSSQDDTIKLDLIYEGARWWIFDPPLPRISKNTLIELYENDLKGFDGKWLKKASNEQKKIYFRKQETLKILKSLSN